MKKIAVVLLNLGGPDAPESVQPFLFNLFNDKAIIGAPQPVRWAIAKLISTRRAPVARAIYQHLGGKSPLLELTREQAEGLEAALGERSFGFAQDTDELREVPAFAGTTGNNPVDSSLLHDERGQQTEPLVAEGVRLIAEAVAKAGANKTSNEYKVFIAMRYWHPMTAETVAAVKEWGAEEVVLLPLYPQFSTTTTGSSFKLWEALAKKQGLRAVTHRVGCYPLEPGFVSAHARLLAERVREAAKAGPVRVLFSAHGLPQKIVDAGDPYQWQIEQTSAAIVAALEREQGVVAQSKLEGDPGVKPQDDGLKKSAGFPLAPEQQEEPVRSSWVHNEPGQETGPLVTEGLRPIAQASRPEQGRIEQPTSDSAHVDWSICYQSRVGPLQWLKPSTETAIAQAAGEGRGIVLVPVAFVSEHSETLVELDIEYRHLAEKAGVSTYLRVPALGVQAEFIAGLARVVRQAVSAGRESTTTDQLKRLCPAEFGKCVCMDMQPLAAA